MRRVKPPAEKHASDFRVLRLGSAQFATSEERNSAIAAFNLARFKKYVERLGYRLRRTDPHLSLIRIKTRRRKRAARAAGREW